jgi:hypothetical protein
LGLIDAVIAAFGMNGVKPEAGAAGAGRHCQGGSDGKT